MSQPQAYNRRLHWLALLTVVATFPLIFLGGMVTSKQAGLSVPDWPNSYGYNMFLFPPNRWLGGIFYEHTHRLLATVVGFCAVLLTLKAWGFGRTLRARQWLRAIGTLVLTIAGACALVVPSLPPGHGTHFGSSDMAQVVVGFVCVALILFCASLMRQPEPRRWVRWLATCVLAMVIVQGILGGLRVVLIDLDLAIVHACVAQAFFCLAAFTALVTSRWWITAPNDASNARGRGLVTAAIVAIVVIYGQLIAGAVMRHEQAGLAIPDVPLTYGKLLPPTNGAELAAINQLRVHDLNLPAVTLGQIWIHFTHRLGALAVTICLIVLIFKATKLRRGELTWMAMLLAVLLVGQITLGVLTVLLRKPADIASLHVAVGALLLVTTFVLAVRGMRLYWAGMLERVEYRRIACDEAEHPMPRPLPA